MVKSTTPTAYSYIRFSTPEQALGDSERRQLALTRDFVKRKGWRLDESLKPDRGLSGYHGVHRKRGVLGAFLRQVQSGTIERGSVLVVENADRLSREGVETTLRKIIFELWDYGITIQTLSPEESYEPGCGNDVKFLAFCLYLTRAYDESERKSKLVRAARESARESARTKKKILTARCPAWLTVQGGRFVVNKDAAKTIKRIFEWYSSGVGVREIERTLNRKSEWKRGDNGWRHSYIKKILSNRAVVGEYQPFAISNEQRIPIGEPIPDYYPRVVPDALFASVQERLSGNRGTGGQNGKVSNLFKGLVTCPYCGGKMHFIDKGGRGSSWLECDNGRRNVKCAKHRIHYDEVETVILQNCKYLRPEAVLPNPDEQNQLCESLRKKIAGNEAKTRQLAKKVQNLLDQIEDAETADQRKTYQERISQRQAEIASITQTIENDRRELTRAETSAKSLERWQTDLESLRKALQKKDDIALRMRLQAHLRQLIQRVEVWSDGYAELYDMTKKRDLSKIENRCETIELELYERMAEPDSRFIRYVVQERMSRRGRFVRIFFVSGISIDVVPSDSIASGFRLYVDSDGKRQWGFVHPDFDRLREEV